MPSIILVTNVKTGRYWVFASAAVAHQVYSEYENLSKRKPFGYSRFTGLLQSEGEVRVGYTLVIKEIELPNREATQHSSIVLLRNANSGLIMLATTASFAYHFYRVHQLLLKFVPISYEAFSNQLFTQGSFWVSDAFQIQQVPLLHKDDLEGSKLDDLVMAIADLFRP